jgi:hypothetical protein
MNRFQLFLETSDSELFRKATSELGTIFYKQGKDESQWLIIYFSGSRIARFEGTPNDALLTLCEAIGYEVAEIEFDEAAGTLKVKQK